MQVESVPGYVFLDEKALKPNEMVYSKDLTQFFQASKWSNCLGQNLSKKARSLLSRKLLLIRAQTIQARTKWERLV